MGMKTKSKNDNQQKIRDNKIQKIRNNRIHDIFNNYFPHMQIPPIVITANKRFVQATIKFSSFSFAQFKFKDMSDLKATDKLPDKKGDSKNNSEAQTNEEALCENLENKFLIFLVSLVNFNKEKYSNKIYASPDEISCYLKNDEVERKQTFKEIVENNSEFMMNQTFKSDDTLLDCLNANYNIEVENVYANNKTDSNLFNEIKDNHKKIDHFENNKSKSNKSKGKQRSTNEIKGLSTNDFINEIQFVQESFNKIPRNEFNLRNGFHQQESSLTNGVIDGEKRNIYCEANNEPGGRTPIYGNDEKLNIYCDTNNEPGDTTPIYVTDDTDGMVTPIQHNNLAEKGANINIENRCGYQNIGANVNGNFAPNPVQTLTAMKNGISYYQMVNDYCIENQIPHPEYTLEKQNGVFICRALFYDIQFTSKYFLDKKDAQEDACARLYTFIQSNPQVRRKRECENRNVQTKRIKEMPDGNELWDPKKRVSSLMCRDAQQDKYNQKGGKVNYLTKNEAQSCYPLVSEQHDNYSAKKENPEFYFSGNENRENYLWNCENSGNNFREYVRPQDSQRNETNSFWEMKKMNSKFNYRNKNLSADEMQQMKNSPLKEEFKDSTNKGADKDNFWVAKENVNSKVGENINGKKKEKRTLTFDDLFRD